MGRCTGGAEGCGEEPVLGEGDSQTVWPRSWRLTSHGSQTHFTPFWLAWLGVADDDGDADKR